MSSPLNSMRPRIRSSVSYDLPRFEASTCREFIERHWTQPARKNDPNAVLIWSRALSDNRLRAPHWPNNFGGRDWSIGSACQWWSLCAQAGCPLPLPLEIELVGPILLLTRQPEVFIDSLIAISQDQERWAALHQIQGDAQPMCFGDASTAEKQLNITDTDGTLTITINGRAHPKTQIPVMTTDLETLLERLACHYPPVLSIWRNHGIITRLSDMVEHAQDEDKTLAEAVNSLKIEQEAHEALCLRATQSGAFSALLLVTPKARSLTQRAGQITRTIQGYYSLAPLDPPGRNETYDPPDSVSDPVSILDPFDLSDHFYKSHLTDVSASDDSRSLSNHP